MTDALDKAADALDTAAGSAADTVKADTTKVADAAKADTTKAAGTAKAETAKVAGTAKAETAKVAGTAKAETAKVADTVKVETAKAADAVAAKADSVAAKADTVAAKADAVAAKATEKGSDAPPPPRSMDEIEAELQATRDRLAGRIDDLTDYVKPANVVERQKAKLKGVFVDEYGGIKPDRVLMVAGVVVAILGLGVLRRRRRRG